MSDLKELMNQQRIDHDKEVIDQAFSVLVDTKDRNKIPVEMFTKEFLPYFSGQSNVNENPDVLRNWITIAGNGFREVEVVDSKGEQVAIIPGINSTLNLQVTNSAMNIHEAMRQVEIKGSQFPKRGEDYMLGAFEHKRNEMLSGTPDTLTDTASKWKQVFKTFGVDAIDSTSSTVQVKTPPIDTDMEFE